MAPSVSIATAVALSVAPVVHASLFNMSDTDGVLGMQFGREMLALGKIGKKLPFLSLIKNGDQVLDPLYRIDAVADELLEAVHAAVKDFRSENGRPAISTTIFICMDTSIYDEEGELYSSLVDFDPQADDSN